MIQSIIRFHRGVFRLPLRVQLLLGLLITLNMVAPLYFISHIEAKLVLAAFIISASLMFALTAKLGFTRILGLGHILWIPLIYYVTCRLPSQPIDSLLGQWLRLLIALNALALILDIIDVTRYLRGDKAEMVDGL